MGDWVFSDLPNTQSPIFLRPAVGEGAADHFDVRAFIYADHLAARALYSGACRLHRVVARDAIFITAQDGAFADFLIFPQLAFTRSTFNRKHRVYYTQSAFDCRSPWRLGGALASW